MNPASATRRSGCSAGEIVALTIAVCVLVAVGGCASSSGPSEADEPAGPEPPEMVLIPSGSFVMGDGEAINGVDQRGVTLTGSYYLCQHEVTNQEYIELVQWAYDNGHASATSLSVKDNLDGSTVELLDLSSPSAEIVFSDGTFGLRDGGYGLNADHPVTCVTWYGAARYCDWLSLAASLARSYNGGFWLCNGGDPYTADGYRLPTDAEWEYAAQYSDERVYPWGGEVPSCGRANYGPSGPCVGWTTQSGSCPDGNTSLGLSDMAGNVYEWCNDWFLENLGTSPATDPVGPVGGSRRVLRGGCWNSYGFVLRCSWRSHLSPGATSTSLGFRATRTSP